MPIRPLSIPDFLGGVSQQAGPQRLVNQFETMDNAWSSPQDGLIKRHPFVHGARLTTLTGDLDRLLHPIDRDASEQYVVDITRSGIRVFDLDGEEYLVRTPAGATPDFSYLDITRPQLLDNGEVVAGSGWTLTNLTATLTEYRSPFDKGTMVTYRAGSASAADGEVAVGSGPGTTTDGQILFSVYVKQDPLATADADIELEVNATNGITQGTCTAAFTWSGTALVTDGTTAGGTLPVASSSAVIDVGDGWYRAVLLAGVPTAASIYATVGTIHLPAGTDNRSVGLFGAQMLYDVVDDPAEVPSYFIDTVRGGITATTYADTTFIANRAIPVAFDTGAIAAPTLPSGVGDRAVVWIREGGFQQRYSMSITFETDAGSGTATVDWVVTTPAVDGTSALLDDNGDTVAADPDPAQIAASFAVAGVTSQFSSNGTTAANGALVIITVDTGYVITSVDLTDSLGDEAMVLLWDEVTDINDLPKRAVEQHLTVSGVAQRPEDDYYVVFEQTDSTNGGLDGRWVETGAIGLSTTLDAATLPHVLVRRRDDNVGTATGTPNSIYFSFEEYEWDDRLVGDENSNPSSLLIGAQIQDLGFFRARFFMVADRSVIFSEVNNPGNVWRTTVRQLLDSDPIHIEIPDSNVAQFHHAVPLERELTVFSDSAVYRVGGEPILSPSTVQAETALELTTDADAQPHPFGDTLLAFGRANGQTTSYEVLIPPESSTLVRFADLSAHVPRYVSGRAVHTAASSAASAFVIVPSGNTNTLFMFQQYLTPSNERVQAAWQRMVFPEDTTTISAAFVRERLAVVFEKRGDIVLEFADIVTRPQDDGLDYIVTIDRRVSDLDLDPTTDITYDAGSDTTTFVLPYNFSGGGAYTGNGRPVVVTREDGSGVGGRRLYVTGTSGGVTTSSVTVLGDYSTTPVYLGESYVMSVQLSTPFYRVADQTGRQIPYQGGTQRAVALSLQYEDSAHFQVVVSPPLRAEQRLVWNTPLGTGAQIGPAQLDSGSRRTFVQTMNHDAVVTLENPSPFPSRFTSGEWELDLGSHR